MTEDKGTHPVEDNDALPPERRRFLERYPPTWFVSLLWIIVASVFVFRWDYGRLSDVLMGASLGVVTALWWIRRD